MIDSGGDAASLAYAIGLTIVVGKGGEAGGAEELRHNRAAGVGIRKEDGIQRSDTRVRSILEQPSCRRRRSVGVESDLPTCQRPLES